MTRADCEADRINYGRFLLKLADPGEHPYCVFAGHDLSDALAFMTLLMFLPPLFAYALMRTSIAAAWVCWRGLQLALTHSMANSLNNSRIDCGASATTSQYSSS